MIEVNLGTGKNLNEVQKLNRTLILSLLEKSDICSRAELAKQSGLQQATITNIINDFIRWGVVVETGIIAGNKGRRSIGITINATQYHIIGLRLTRNYFNIGLFNLKGKVLFSEQIPISQGESAQAVLQNMIDETKRFLNTYKDWNILAIGVSVPGPYLPKEGKMYAIMGFPGWNDICLQKRFAEEFSIPVIVDHDAKAGVLASWWVSRDVGTKTNVIYIALGQGIGSGVMINGQVLYGNHGIAGEIGHTRILLNRQGNRDQMDACLTNQASTINFMKAVRNRQLRGEKTSLSLDFDIHQLLDAVKTGDPLAVDEYNRILNLLACTISNLIWCYNPDVIILGDELAEIGISLAIDLKKRITETIPSIFISDLEVKISSLPDDPAFIGAAALAIEYALGHPDIFEVS